MSANSAQHTLAFVPEVTYGTTPASPAFAYCPIKGTTLALTKGTFESETIRADRQLADVRPGNRQVGGEINFELAYGNYDTLLAAVLCGTWSARVANKVATTISAAAADNSINDSANGLPIYVAGERVTISGFTGTVGNNQTGTVVTSTVSKLVLTTDTPLVDDAAGESVTLALPLSVLTPGTVRRSFSFLRNYSDLSSGVKPFHLFAGVELNTLNVSLASEAMTQVTVGCLGRSVTQSATEPAGSTYTNASDNPFIDSFSGELLVDGVAVATVTELSLDLENGMEPRFVLFDDKTRQPKIGKTRVTGSMGLFFENSDMLVAFNGGLTNTLAFTLEDALGNTYLFELPKILVTGAQADVEGESDITVTLPFTASYDADESAALRVTRTDA